MKAWTIVHTLLLVALLNFCEVCDSAIPIGGCVSRFISEWIVGPWPKAKIIVNGVNPWVPVLPGVDSQKLNFDLVDSGHLVLVTDGERRISYRSVAHHWTVDFIRGDDSGISYVEIIGEGQRFWLAGILDKMDLLDSYFDNSNVKMADIPE